MLDDTTGFLETETKPDVFTLENLRDWLEKQPAKRTYCWKNTHDCLMTQYLRDVGGTEHPSRDYIFAEVLGDGWPYYAVALSEPHTMGAALTRTEAAIEAGR